jgi:uncharacterized protein involved in type VI secretion and phage assembly
VSATSPKGDPIVIGVVRSLEDPQNLGRVRVELPHLDGKKSAWCRISTLMAGKDRGSLFRPEPDDEVLVGLVHGDTAQAYVLGGLWNETDTPPENGGTKDNHLRTLRSRSGHVFRFDDTPGSTKIEVIGSDEKQRWVIDVGQKKISVEADEGDVSVKTKQGKVEVDSGSDVSVKAKGSFKVEAAEITLEATGNVTIKGAQVGIN